MASWPLALVILPPQHTVTGVTAWLLIGEITFVACLVGVGAALAVFGDHRWLLAQMAPRDRFRVELGGLLAAAWVATVATLLPALAFTPGAEPRFESSAHLAVAFVTVSVHVAALGLVLLRMPIPSERAPLALVAVAWGAPAVLSGEDRLTLLLSNTLDPTLPLGLDWTSRMTWTGSLADMMPVAALLIWSRWLPSAAPPRS